MKWLMALSISWAILSGCFPTSDPTQEDIIKRLAYVQSYMEAHGLDGKAIHCGNRSSTITCEFSEVQQREVKVTHSIWCSDNGICGVTTNIQYD